MGRKWEGSIKITISFRLISIDFELNGCMMDDNLAVELDKSFQCTKDHLIKSFK